MRVIVLMAFTADVNCVSDGVVDEQAGSVQPGPGDTAATLLKADEASGWTAMPNGLLIISAALGKQYSDVDPDTEVCVRSSEPNPSDSSREVQQEASCCLAPNGAYLLPCR